MNSIDTKAPTVVVKLQGGIGNQLFQHAFGQYLQIHTKCTVKYATDSFATDPYGRKSVLQRIDSDIPLIAMVDLDFENTRILKEDALLGRLDPSALESMLREHSITTCVLDGYWQDLNCIPPEYKTWLNEKLSAIFVAAVHDPQDILMPIVAVPNSIGVHVRRHDYKHHGICNENFYIDGLQWLLAVDPQASVFVFSDEPNYTGLFLREAGIHHRIVASGDDLKDLYAMTKCNKHIIANSSFSWWGAMLASSTLPIFPMPWSFVQTPSETLFPSAWRSVDDAVEKHLSKLNYSEQLNLIQL